MVKSIGCAVIAATMLALASPVSAKTCKQVSSCEEAVRLWCSGYSRADRDKDGIPCENVCPSKKLVDEIRRKIGC
ncbi:MAG: excalibur calcium-binding domain-containing protein [Rhizobiaceae bacterium]